MHAEGDCFLTVVIRTQGPRPVPLTEVLAGLADQTDRDFEVELVRHRADEAGRRRVEDVLDGVPGWLRQRIRVHDLDTGARGAPLNTGWAAARGAYVVVLDDDDLVLPHWVATFRTLSQQAPGRALRAAALLQRVEPVTENGQVRASPLEEPHRHWPVRFEFLEHLLVNHTPCMSIAFPRSVFHDLGERYDEELATTEDWDFLMRAVSWVGVVDSDEATSVYRWWETSESSRHVHDDDAWQDNHLVVQDRLDERVLLLPRRLRHDAAHDDLRARPAHRAGPRRARSRGGQRAAAARRGPGLPRPARDGGAAAAQAAQEGPSPACPG